MCADQNENAAPLLAVIFKNSFRQWWTVVRTATQKLVKIDGHNLVLQCVAWVHAPDVRAEWALQSLHVIFITEVVIAVQVSAYGRIITLGSQHQRRAAAPSSNHLRRNQFLFFG